MSSQESPTAPYSCSNLPTARENLAAVERCLCDKLTSLPADTDTELWGEIKLETRFSVGMPFLPSLDFHGLESQ